MSAASAWAEERRCSISLIVEVRVSSSSLSCTMRMSSASREAWAFIEAASALAVRSSSSARCLAEAMTSSACSSARRSSSLARPPSPAYVGFSFSLACSRSEASCFSTSARRLRVPSRSRASAALSALSWPTLRSTAAVS